MELGKRCLAVQQPHAGGPAADEGPVTKKPKVEQLMVLPEDFECSVCYELILDPVVGRCGHDFCKHCIDEWRNKLGSRVTCPVCRETLLVGSRDALGVCRRLRDWVEKLFPDETATRRAKLAAYLAAKAAAKAKQQQQHEQQQQLLLQAQQQSHQQHQHQHQQLATASELGTGFTGGQLGAAAVVPPAELRAGGGGGGGRGGDGPGGGGGGGLGRGELELPGPPFSSHNAASTPRSANRRAEDNSGRSERTSRRATSSSRQRDRSRERSRERSRGRSSGSRRGVTSTGSRRSPSPYYASPPRHTRRSTGSTRWGPSPALPHQHHPPAAPHHPQLPHQHQQPQLGVDSPSYFRGPPIMNHQYPGPRVHVQAFLPYPPYSPLPPQMASDGHLLHPGLGHPYRQHAA